jgi:hypothetical protein
MSASPSKELEVEVGDQSPDEEHMERGQGEASQQPVFDFEVKEQDRWLPIANGEWVFLLLSFQRDYSLASSYASFACRYW